MTSSILSLTDPRRFFGFEPGNDRQLASYSSMLSYFEALATETPRLHVEQIGESAEGRPLVALFVSSEGNVSKLDELQQVHSRLADPRVLTQEERQELEATARSVVLVTLGIHPAEIASSQTAPVLVHDLISREDEQAATIRDNTIVIVVPSVNPDGFDLVYDWYQKTFGTTAEGTWPPSITQKYAGGENNRDWFLLTQPEQRAVVERIFRRWHPHVGLDHHQMEEYGFRYFIPPYADPINPNIDPAIQAATSSIGMRIASDLTSAGLGGVVTGLFFSQYSPATTYSPYHGGVHILTEGASCRLATPIDIAPGQIAPFHGADPNLSRVCQPLPWTGGRWGMREIIAYNMAATLSAIEEVALNRPNWVRRQVDVRQRACTANGKSAFVIPAEQSDRKLAEELVEALLRGGVEVHRAGETFSAGGRQYDAGAFIVRLDQSASAYAKALLEYQPYPLAPNSADDRVLRPYDVTVNNLPLFFGVACNKVEELPNIAAEAMKEMLFSAGAVAHTADGPFILSCGTNASALAVNLLLKEGATVGRMAAACDVAGKTFPAGSYVVEAPFDQVEEVAQQAHVEFQLAADLDRQALRPVVQPRLGVYRSWLTGFAACDEGWMRYVLDQHAFPFRTLRNRSLHRADLAGEFDAIVLPQHLPGDLMFGHDPYSFAGATPHQRNRSVDDGAKSGQLADYPEEYAEGIGEAGMAGLRAFVEAGGTLIAIDTSADAIIRYLDLPVTNALADLPEQVFYNPGSVMRFKVDPMDALCFGFDEEATGIFVNSPAFEAQGDAEAVATYSGDGNLVAGWMIGGERLAGKAALVRVPLGRGQVVLFGFRPHFRAQMRASYRFLFNAIFSSGR